MSARDEAQPAPPPGPAFGGAADRPVGIVFVVFGVSLWALIGLLTGLTNTLDLGPFPQSVYPHAFLIESRDIARRLADVEQHELRRWTQSLRWTGLGGVLAFLPIAVGLLAWWSGLAHHAGAAELSFWRARGLRALGWTLLTLAACFAIWLAYHDLTTSLGIGGMRIQTEVLGRSVAEARRFAVMHSAVSGLAMAAAYAVGGALLLAVARWVRARG